MQILFKSHLFFDNVDASLEFVTENVSSNPHVKIIIFIGGGLVHELVSSAICYGEQLQLILVINKPPHLMKKNENQ